MTKAIKLKGMVHPRLCRAVASQLCTIVTLTLASTAFAASETDNLMKEGVQLRRSGHDSEAIPKFESAYRLSKTPRAAAQLGLCLQAISRWSEADPMLAEALAATDDPWIKKNRSTLKESLEQVKAHVGRVEVVGDPAGATVMVAGRLVGTFPLPAAVTVNEGVVDVEVSAGGFIRAVRTVNISGSSYQRIVMRLESARSPSTVATPGTPKLSSAPGPDLMPVVNSGLGAPTDAPPPATQKWFWIGTAAGVATIAVIGALIFASRDSFPDAGQVRTLD